MFDDLIDARPISTRQKLIFAVCLIVLIIDGMDAQMLAFASPVLLSEWHVTKAQLAPALAVSLIGTAVGALIGGFAGDRFGCRRTLIVIVAAFGMTTFGTALAGGVTQLIVLRLMSGIGFGVAVPTAMALASEWCPRALRGQLVLLMSIGTMLGGTLGGLLAAWLIPAYGWRSIFVAAGAITAVAAALSMIYLPESLVFLIRKTRQDEALVWIKRVLGGDVTALPVGGDRKRLDASVPEAGARLLSSSNLRVNAGLWVGFFALSYAAFAYVTWTPAVFVGAGFDVPAAIRCTSVYTFSAVLGVLVCAVFLPRAGSRMLLLLSIAMGICASIAFPSLLAGGVAKVSALNIAMVFAGFGGGMSQSTIYALAATVYPATYRATALGVCVGISRVGGILSALGGGVLLEAGGPGGTLFFSVIVGMLVAGLIALAVMNRHTRSAATHARGLTV
ncbi:MFS transporter [Burkholderia sp. S171]|uniref:MFS transporter n=1 Tax=Burkholderia sp. S171 TaxID=1641860 RepID=UPI00131DC900|nr:MFS transporter [Burkholderia sp. S171]